VTHVVSHSPGTILSFSLLSVEFRWAIRRSRYTFLTSRVASPKAAHALFAGAIFSFLVNRELRGDQKVGRGRKETRFPIQRRWLSATFGEIIIWFVECRRPSRKKLPISNLGSRLGRGMTQLHIYPPRIFSRSFFSLLPPEKRTTAAHNFCHFFFFISASWFNYFKRATTRAIFRTQHMIHKIPSSAVIDSFAASF